MIVPKVWLKSRIPGASARLTMAWLDRTATGYADIERSGLRFRFSHEAVLRGEGGEQETWLVFVHEGSSTRSPG